MTDDRIENEKRFAVFRERLAKGFYIVDPDTGDVLEDDGHQRALDSMKPWRNELWKAYCPACSVCGTTLRAML